MNDDYDSLKSISKILKVVGAIIQGVAFLTGIIFISSNETIVSFLIGTGIILLGSFSLLIMLALSEAIVLMLNIAADIKNTSENSNLLVKMQNP